ncbi:OmpA family protein [Pedobacter psychroterrae]|uniref:OmpA-like domain-containing protein n=1 Tax=Pedobacter psychroterrae TaxID=2530453 RepID=A0A4R0NLK9_9SPHI|nr:OmpA family protein [Pedobacter psychroterrae]TCD00423.1 hypothetical protein EZ437_14455 [Pedobacter psychroterrae]
MKNYLLMLCLLIAGTVTAQNKAFKTRADKAFAEKDYATAAFYYDKAQNGETITKQGKVPYFSKKQRFALSEIAEVNYQLAESYRLSNNYAQAEELYKEVIEGFEASYPMARLWYGVCLRSNNKLDQAEGQLNLFIGASKDNKQYTTMGNNELKDCLFAKQQSKLKATASIVKLESSFSTDENDFAVSISDNKYWFTGTSALVKNKNLNHIFVTERDSLSKKTNLSFPDDAKLPVHSGTPSLDSSGKKMYLTKWYKEGDKVITGIYLSKYSGQNWSNPYKLNNFVNAGGANAMQPFVTPDGKYLYFISNRMGGIGGNDIWMSELDANGMPLNAVNMGNKINTGADENTPYYHQPTKRLIFSSKGYVGMGNFDLYESTAKGDSSWTVPRNMGAPYNSTKDDLYYYIDDTKEGTAYLSSDRESDCCLNLFKVTFAKPERQSAIFAGRVTDCETNVALSDVRVELIDSLTKKIQICTTNTTGEYQFKIGLKKNYLLRLEKEGYFSKVVLIPPFQSLKKDTLRNADICLQKFIVDKPIVIENVLYDFNKAILKPESLVVLDGLVSILTDNPKIRIELSAHTDSIGPDLYNNKLSQQRAQSCVDYIISMGISTYRIAAKGYGETRPVQPNSLPNGKDNREGRRLNRRTEFKVLSIN